MSSFVKKVTGCYEKGQDLFEKASKKIELIEKKANAIIPDFEDNTPDVLKRKLTVRIPFLRMNQMEREQVKNEFERIAIGGVIDQYAFRMNIMGPQVPELISTRIFNMFASKESKEQQFTKKSHLSRYTAATTIGHLGKDGNVPTFDAMSHEDLECCFVFFSQQKPQEMAELSYELMKLTRDQEKLLIDDLQHFCSHMIAKDPEFVLQFYQKSNLDPRIPITRAEFVKNYNNIAELEMFSFIPKLADGFKTEYLNINSDLFKDFATAFQKLHLGEMGLDQFKNKLKKIHEDNEEKKEQFCEDDITHVKTFFDQNILNQNWSNVLKIYQNLFKQMSNPQLVKILLQSIMKNRANHFEFFLTLSNACVKEIGDKPILSFFFDIFSEFEKVMSEDQLQTFCNVFELNENEVEIDKRQKDEFIQLFDEYSESLGHAMRECKYSVIGYMGVSCDGTVGEQRTSVLTLLDQEYHDSIDIQTYISDNLDLETKYYVLDKVFWDRWLETTDEEETIIKQALKQNEELPKNKQNKKLTQKLAINNKSLLLKDHKTRIDFDNYKHNEGFVLVPKNVFNSLSIWYECDQVIEFKSQINDVNSKAIEAVKKQLLEQEEKEDQDLSADFEQKVKDTEESRGINKVAPDIYASSADVTLINDYKTKSGNDSTAAGLVTEHKEQPLSLKIKNKITDSELEKDEAQTYRPGSNPDFEKVLGEKQHNLDVQQLFLYFAQLSKGGTKEHKDCIVDGTLDPKYLKKNKLEKSPFKEVNASKYSTFGALLKHFSEVFGQAGGRLHVGEEVVEGIQLEKTLVELNIKSADIIWVEFLGPDSNWPSDLVVKDAKKKKRGQMGESQGLVNTGNTCYMNSTLQCLVNIKPFYQYFIDEKTFERQINLVSDEGHEGDLVLAFGQLFHQLWNQDNAVTPKWFLQEQSQLNPQFNGDDQQDVMHYLQFLIDGVHEDVNLIKRKVEVPTPSSQDRDLLELALESWSNSLRKEWSFIFFMFYGQQRTTLKCLNCSKESSTYEMFSSLPLPLYDSENINLQVLVQRLPWMVKSTFSRDEQNDTHNGTAESDDKKYQKSFAKLTNNQQLRICLSVKKNIKISELITRIVVIPEANIDMDQFYSQKYSELILFSQDHGVVRGVFDPDCKLTQYKLFGNDVYAQEVLTERGREYIRLMYARNKMMKNFQAGILCNLKEPDEQIDNRFEGDQNKKTQEYEEFKETYIFNNQLAANEKFERLYQMKRLPSHVLAVAYHRRFVQLESSLLGKFSPELISQPIVVRLPLEPTGREIYDEIWALAHGILKQDSKYFDRENLWWNKSNWKQILERSKHQSELKPFVLKFVDRGAFNCTKCNWVEMCSGCILEPNPDIKIHRFLTLSNLAIEWHSQTVGTDFDSRTNDIVNHQSVSLFDKAEPNVQSLSECLHEFYDAEVLREELKCTRCREFQEHTKESQIFRPPPILTIQLKRFKKLGFSWRKSNIFVDFPVVDLDLYDFIQDEEFNEDNGIMSMYDLCGVICHFGSMTFGHYYSVVKNPFDDQWYKYDDHSKTPITENQIPKHNAYILFYQRQDVKDKKLNTLFPTDFTVFPGLPVTTKSGLGFVLGPKEPDDEDQDPYVYYIKIPATDRIEEYHKDDLRLMLQTSGTAYYEDADAQNSIRNNTSQDFGSKSMFSKFGSLFSKSKEVEMKNLKSHEQISKMDSKNQKIKQLLIAKNDKERLESIDLKKIKPFDAEQDPRGISARLNAVALRAERNKNKLDPDEEPGVHGILGAAILGAALKHGLDDEESDSSTGEAGGGQKRGRHRGEKGENHAQGKVAKHGDKEHEEHGGRDQGEAQGGEED